MHARFALKYCTSKCCARFFPHPPVSIYSIKYELSRGIFTEIGMACLWWQASVNSCLPCVQLQDEAMQIPGDFLKYKCNIAQKPAILAAYAKRE